MKNKQNCAFFSFSLNFFFGWICPIIIFFSIGLIISYPFKLFAADDKFRGYSLKPLSGKYLVLKDVNVRLEPKTKSKRKTRLKAGEWVEAFGRPKDRAWIAVIKGGKKLGFIFAPALMPILDGKLKNPLQGVIKKNGKECKFNIKFIGKSKVQGEVFKTSDYENQVKCKSKGKIFEFTLPMFIAEGPYRSEKKQHYQINVDLLQIDTKRYDEHFSVIIIYQVNKKRIVFDSVTVAKFGITPLKKTKPAESIEMALKGATEIALNSWGLRVWRVLEQNYNIIKKK